MPFELTKSSPSPLLSLGRTLLRLGVLVLVYDDGEHKLVMNGRVI